MTTGLPFISVLKKLCAHKNIYLVGGYLRDFFLKRTRNRYDLDFAVDKNAISLARNFAQKIKAGFVILDKLHGCARVVKKYNHQIYIFDFSNLRAKNIKEDLLKRDFTINALAVDLKSEDTIIDPAGGIEDLKKKIIRVTSLTSFNADPLRVMRAFSLAAQLGFRINTQTLKLIKKYKKKLTDSAFERIRDELFKILDTEDSYSTLKKLDDLKILELIIPQIKVMQGVEQGPYHHLDVWQHSKEALKQLEIVLREVALNKNISDYLNEVLVAERRRYQLIKLGALLHDIGKPQSMQIEEGRRRFHGHERIGLKFIKAICERLKLANLEEDALRLILLHHLRPGYLSDNKVISPRAKFRFFRDTKSEAASILLISLADQRATRGPLTKEKDRKHHEEVVHSLIEEFFRVEEQKPLLRLLTGNDIIKELKLKPGPIFSKILKGVEELQATGKIRTKKEAFVWARKFLRHR